MVNIIVAYDLNMAIGYNNKIPWHIPKDLERFKNITTGKTVVMGHKTYNSIGHPLPNRINIVLSKTVYKSDKVTYLTDYKQCLNINDVFIIGGEQIYTLFMPYVQKIFITAIEYKFNNTDTYFKWNKNDFKCISSISFCENYQYSFQEYIRK